MSSDLVSYYQARAKEYEQIYSKPERQEDLVLAGKILQEIFINKKVIEIACGTGYWTEKIAATAASIVATDINASVIDIAQTKIYSPAKVIFQVADLYDLKNSAKYESLFGGFIWSHIKLEDLPGFIDSVNGLTEKGGTIVFMDNKFVEGSNIPISYKDEKGNTFQARKLENGTSHQVLKNFPSEKQVRDVLTGKARDIEYIDMEYFWIVKYVTI
jgi:SAM-dependent methyltransferase